MKKIFERLSNELVLRIGFAVSVGILFMASFFSYETNKALISNAQWVDHTSLVIRKLNGMLITIKDAQLSQKNFLMTNDEKYLGPYFNGREKFDADLKEFQSITTDNEIQQTNAKLLKGLVAGYFDKLDGLISLKRSQTFIYDPLAGKKELDEMVSVLTTMRSAEMELLAIRAKKFEDSSASAPSLIILFSLIALGFAIVSYVVISNNIGNIRKKESSLQEAYEEVQTINEELTATNEELRALNEEMNDSRQRINLSNEKLMQNQEEMLATNEELKESLHKINTYKLELEVSKSRLLEAQEIANVGNWEWDIATNHIYWSDQLIKMFDHDPSGKEKFDYETYLTLLHPDDKHMIDEAVEKIMKDHKPYTIEHRLLKKDGRIAWILAKGRVILGEDSKLLKLAGTSLDITELKEARSEEEKLIAVINNSFDFIGLSDNEGKIIFVNEAGRNMVGLSNMKEAINVGITDFFAEADLETAMQNVMPIVREKGSWVGEIHFRHFKTGHLIPVRWNVFQVMDKTNIPIGVAYISQDLTAEKETKQELQRINEELSAAVEELRQAEENLMLMNRDLEARVAERGKELVISEERFRIVSMATNDAIWDWDLQTDKLWWNEGFKTMFGYQNEQIEPGIESLHNRIHPQDKDRIVREVKKFLISGKSQWKAEYRFQNSSGSYIDVMERGYVIYNELGKPYRMLGSLVNITERKELENERIKLHEQAEAQRKRLYTLLMNIPAAITIMKGRDYVYEVVNDQYRLLAGLPEEDLIGKSRKSMQLGEGSEKVIELMDEIYKTGKSFSRTEFPVEVFRNGKNEKAYFNLLLEPIYDDNRQIEGIMTFAVDVTDQVLARQSVEVGAERARMMLEAIPQMAWTNDPEGEMLFFNAKWYEYTGANFEQSKGWEWVKFLHPDDQQRTVDLWKETLSAGRIFETEYRLKRGSDSTYRWMLVRAMPLRNNDNEIMKWVGSSTDIHDQKIITNDLNKKNQELVKVNELLDTFVYTAAHDLKSPVINLKGLFTLIKETEDTLVKEEYFNTIDVAVKRLDDTINGLVEVIDVQSEDNKIAREISFEDTLALVMEEFAPTLNNIGGQVNADFTKRTDILYLKSYLNSIFTNLVGNAIKYRSADKPLMVNITSYNSEDYVVLIVSDNGIGIDLTKNGNKIFKAFNRFSRNAEGKGLGLYLIKTMVERNGGKLEVESELNEGTTFKIYLKEYI